MTLIERWSKEYLRLDNSYENHINKFVNYIKQIDKADKPIKVNLADVENCIAFYNQLDQINTVSSMENHLESIKSFYKYLLKKGWTADIFAEMYDYPSYKKSIIGKLSLEKSQEREYFDQSIMKEILSCLDNYLESKYLRELSGQKRKRYLSYMLLRLFIKLTIIAPTKRAVICNIKKGDFAVDFRTLNINNVKVNIPNGLRKEILLGIRTIEKIKDIKISESDFLFTFLDDSTFRPEHLNIWFCNFLKEFEIINIPDKKTTYSVESVRNSVLVELIKKGFNLALISKVSGVKISSLEKRYYKVKSFDVDEFNKLINEGLAGVPYYSYI